MRLERVVARVFGPFRDETLSFAPGMNVVAGPNEAGKSTWHAAIRAAVCGVRRSKGRGTAAEVAFSDRHRPWDDPERWEVEARLLLDDGRTIDIAQDLAGKVACRAVDIVLGRDVSDEIMDGTPDASRWLGLDRDAFAATICVSQSQILSVAQPETADLLQEHMQRAAATRGTDATAAEAIDRLTEFRRQAVGADTIAAKGPLRGARNKLVAAEEAVAEARRLHDDYVERVALAEEAQREADAARRLLASTELQVARSTAARLRSRAERATELAARHPQPPPGVAARDEHADAVAAALEAWSRRPRAPTLAGPGADELERELRTLPAVPDGDTQPHSSVLEAVRALERIDQALELLGEAPVDHAPIHAAGGSAEALRALAARLRTQPPPAPRELVAERDSALAGLDAAGGGRAAWLLGAAAGVAAVAGLGALIAGWALAGAALVAAALVGGSIGYLASARRRSASRRMVGADGALLPYLHAASSARRERESAAVEAAATGLPTDVDQLDELAEGMGRARAAREARDDWRRRQGALLSSRGAAEEEVRSALRSRGEPPGDLAAYEDRCLQRREQATLAARAESVRQALEARRAAERGAAEAEETRRTAELGLHAAASAVGIEAAGDPELAAAELRAWQSRRSESIRSAEAALDEWRELTSLLDGRSVDELVQSAADAEAQVQQRARALGLDGAASARVGDGPGTGVDEMRQQVTRLSRQADSLAGGLDQLSRSMPDVAEAEEAVEAARVEQERVRRLAETIDLALDLLRTAQERVHRNLAPVLADAVQRWLPAVSGGRYSEVSVNPADLSVSVKQADGGQWRAARLLSEGTREQIYLLLRVAMAEHLVTRQETAPLLLDEVTAQADAQRTRQLLEVLQSLSADRQVILFTHDPLVEAWAGEQLMEPRDSLIRLPAVSRSRDILAIAAS